MAQDVKVEQLGRDGFVWWLGQVEDKKDPAQLGRVKVRIEGWYTGKDYKTRMPTEDLPWAHVLQPSNSGGTKNTGDSANQLEPGAIVMGFFMDGESAQQPCVLGVIRSNISANPNTGEWIADIKGTDYGNTEDWIQNQSASSLFTTADGIAGGNNNVNDGGKDVSPSGTTEARGVAAGQDFPASAANGGGQLNPEPQPAANGVDGPLKTFVRELNWMVKDIALTAGACVPNPNGKGFISAINGSIVNIDKLINRIRSFISYAINGLIADIKALLLKGIQELVKVITKAFAGLPVVVQALINAALKILSKFLCLEFPNFDSLLNVITGMLNQMVDRVMGQMTNQLATVLSSASSTMGNILDSIQRAVSFTSTVFSNVATAIEVVKTTNEAAKRSFKLLEFSKINFTDIISLLMTIIDLIPWECDRGIGNSGMNSWVPLYGTSDCSDSELAQGGFNINSIGTSNNPYAALFEIDPYNTFIKSFPNGAYNIVNNTPGGESTITAGPKGSSKTVRDSKGNEHKDLQGNETKIISGDSCERVKGEKVVTIDGDFKLKVNGNFHIEVAGGLYTNTSQGKDQKTGKMVKSKETFSEAKEIEYKGNHTIAATGKISLTTLGEIELSASTVRNKAHGMSNEIGSEIINSCKTVTNYAGATEWNFIGLDPIIPGPRGQFNQIFGLRTTTMLPATIVPTPVDTYVMPSPGVVLKNITGSFTQNITGPEIRNTTGAFTRNVNGGSVWNTTATTIISAGGPLVLSGRPILLN